MSPTVTDPVVFSWVGQLGIILWGMAYLSVSKSFWKVPHLIAVFAIEKMLYAVAWAIWLFDNQDDLNELSQSSPLMWAFFSTYGFGDFLFGIFFGVVAWFAFKGRFNQD